MCHSYFTNVTTFLLPISIFCSFLKAACNTDRLYLPQKRVHDSDLLYFSGSEERKRCH